MPIPDEQPPLELSEQTRDYLIRMFRSARDEDSRSDRLVILQNLPDRPVKGKIYYFDRAIAPSISRDGYWGYNTQGKWVLLGGQDIVFLAVKSSSQNIGGSTGAITTINWNAAAAINTGFTFSAPSTQIQVPYDGFYNIRAVLSADNTDADRVTLATRVLVNGAVVYVFARGRNYSRGSSYNNISARCDIDLPLLAGAYVEIQSVVDHAVTAGAVVNSIVNETTVSLERLGEYPL